MVLVVSAQWPPSLCSPLSDVEWVLLLALLPARSVCWEIEIVYSVEVECHHCRISRYFKFHEVHNFTRMCDISSQQQARTQRRGVSQSESRLLAVTFQSCVGGRNFGLS